MRKLVNILLGLVIASSLVFPSLVVYAGKPADTRPTLENLLPGQTRVSPTAIKTLTDTNLKAKKDKDGKTTYELEETYNLVVSSLPKTLDDLVTLIDTRWIQREETNGDKYLETRVNLFSARITGTRVTVESDGKICAWDPEIYVGSTSIPLVSGPYIVDDPTNSNYKSNCVKWTYQLKSNGFLGIGAKSITIDRIVRQIEGIISEYYILYQYPGDSLKVISNFEDESGFEMGDILVGYDSHRNPINIAGSREEKIVSDLELHRIGLVYPLTIDPTLVYSGAEGTASAYDGAMLGSGSNYTTIWSATTAYSLMNSYGASAVGQNYSASTYNIWRFALYFDTSGLPTNPDITSGYLSLNLLTQADYSDTDFVVTIQEGMPTHPTMPLTTSEYNKAYYSGSGGTFNTSLLGSGEFQVPLNSDGLDWVNDSGWTKFLLRSNRDIAGTAPTGRELIYICEYEMGAGYEPELHITYTAPAVKPIIETEDAYDITGYSATLEGYLTNDGGATCVVDFKAGTTTSYGYPGTPTPGQSGFSTGMGFTEELEGLEYGTVYHYTARATNSAGVSTDDDVTFLTLPNTVTSFTATPSSEQNALSWTKGTGSTKTMIRRSTSTYPSSPSSGTQVYFDTGSSYNDVGLSNGTTYYYSAFAYVAYGSLYQYSDGSAHISGRPYASEAPTVRTDPAVSITSTGATLKGYLTDLGGAASVTCSFYYGETAEYGDETSTVVLTVVGPFSKTLSDLDISTTYHFQAKGVNVNGTGTGSDRNFTTGGAAAPDIDTQSATGVTKTQATLHGYISDSGGDLCDGWFKWGTSEDLGEETELWHLLDSGANVIETLTGLDIDTTYYFQFVASNTGGTTYGDIVSFTTGSPDAPTCTASEASEVGATSARLYGTVTSSGGVPCEVQFQINSADTWADPDIESGWIPGKIDGDTFTYFVTGLDVDSTYYFRAQVRNSEGTSSSTVKTFTTVFEAPSVFIATAASQSSISLTWVPTGDKTLIVAKVGGYPADRLDGDQVYFGSDTATTVTGLEEGTTYYFRAWSWMEEDTYSDGYVDDVATTLGGDILSSGDTSSSLTIGMDNPSAPSYWNHPVSSEKIQSLPFTIILDEAAESMGMPNASFWTMLSIMVLIFLSGAVGVVSSGKFIMVWLVTSVVAALFNNLWLLPTFVTGVWVIGGGAIAFVLDRGGSS